MANVTVSGASGTTVSLKFDTNSNAVLAREIAGAITAGVQSGTIVPVSDTSGPLPTLASGTVGEFIQTRSGFTSLPAGYADVVVTARNAVIAGSGDPNEAILAGKGSNLTFFATGGSGTVVGGGGDSRIFIPKSDDGSWGVYTGRGNDFIWAAGGGADTISAGGGHNTMLLGDGNDLVETTGKDVVLAGGGASTIVATGRGSDLVYGGAGDLMFVGGKGAATVLGSTGSVTVLGGGGAEFVKGGSDGSNLLTAGFGAATLFGGGTGDTLIAGGSHQLLAAGSGNETLLGGAGSGHDTFRAGSGNDQILMGQGRNTLVAGTGNATITAGGGADRFVFVNHQAGGSELIAGFGGLDKIDLQGYGPKAITDALNSQTMTSGGVTITLSDSTRVTFAGVASLSADDFITGGAGGGMRLAGKWHAV